MQSAPRQSRQSLGTRVYGWTANYSVIGTFSNCTKCGVF
jgi:hypothetical protein